MLPPILQANQGPTALDRILGTGVLIALVCTVTYAKTSIAGLALLALIVFGVWFFQRKDHPVRLPMSVTMALTTAFLIWALVTCAWAPDPRDALENVLIAFLSIGSGYLILAWLSVQPPRRIAHFAFWIVAGYLASATLLLVVLVLDQAPMSWMIKTFGLYSPGESSRLIQELQNGELKVRAAILNPSVAAASLMLVPALVIAWSSLSGWRRLALSALLLSLGYGIVFVSSHESSKLALLVAPIVFLAAKCRHRATTLFLALLWTIAVVLIVPLSLMAHSKLNIDKASWLQHSARDRIAIWAEFAARSKEAPILGAGLRMSRYLNETNTAPLIPRPGKGRQIVSRHPHNVYLQTAFELGAIGSTLMLGAGLALILRTRKASLSHPSVLPLLAMSGIFLGLCWDFWQPWYIAMYMVVAITMAIALLRAEVVERGQSRRRARY